MTDLYTVQQSALALEVSPKRVRQLIQEVCELGWGEPHQFADFGTEIMVYGPRDESEIEIVLGFIGESIAYAREHGLKA